MSSKNATTTNESKAKSSAGTTPAPAEKATPAPAIVGGVANPGELRDIAIADIHVKKGWNMRHYFDDAELAEMAESMKVIGQLSTIVVTARPGGGYWLIAGEKRTRAARLAGLTKLHACVLPESAAEKAALDENFNRSDVSMPDRAFYVKGLRDGGMSNEEIAKRLHLSPQTTSNDFSIASKLAPDVMNGWIASPGASKCILKIYKLDHDAQRAAWKAYKSDGSMPKKAKATTNADGTPILDRPSPTSIESLYLSMQKVRDHIHGRCPEEDYGFVIGALWAMEYMAGPMCDQSDGASPILPQHIRAHFDATKNGSRQQSLFGTKAKPAKATAAPATETPSAE